MLLAINTSTQQFALAVLEPDGIVRSEYVLARSPGHFRHLMPTLDFLLQSAQVLPAQLVAVAVAIGPGSFTGLRVGLSLAKGLCHALNIPVVGVSSLEALAFQMPHVDIPVRPLLDSRRDEFFTAEFLRDTEGVFHRRAQDRSVRVSELASLGGDVAVYIGNDYRRQGPLIDAAMGAGALMPPACQWVLTAAAVGLLALRRLAAHEPDDLENLNPVYFRPPDIRPNPFPLRNAQGKYPDVAARTDAL